MENQSRREKGGASRAFLLALLLASAFFVPLIVYNDGYFLFLGDFNVQQIPFYRLAHEAVRSGEIFWNWHTDLGVNFIGSYSFYLLFSPFFWLTLPFPTSFVPHLMGPLLILKTACAALTSYLYIKRFVCSKNWAVIGSLLYAFSGFMTFNIFFNHFHDVVVFFPLLLVSLEELVQNNRRGFFAAMVAVSCLVNYWFFIGEVVFVVLYVIVRLVTGGWGCRFGRFCVIALESVLGVAIAAVGLLPSVLALMGNPRTGAEDLISGWLMWIYGFNQRLPAIIQSFFFPPEMPSRPMFFPEMGAKWSSLSAWLPLFSASGVIAYCKSRRRDFHKRMIVLSMIMALVPAFNAAFVLFNISYYARWFYMPILMLCVATASALENRLAIRDCWSSGWNWTAGFVLVISLAIGFSPIQEDGEWRIGLYADAAGFWALVAAALLCLLLSRILLFGLPEHRRFEQITGVMLSVVIVVFSFGYLAAGKNSKSYDDWFISAAIDGREKLSMPEEETGRNFVRSDLYDCMDNLGMFWGLPNIQAFHSIVPPSIMEFYPAVGIKRDVSSKPSTTYTALRPLLSVRWLFAASNNESQPPIEGYRLVDSQLGYNLYENPDYLPMGFGYTLAFSESAAGTLGGEQRTRYMLHALQLDDEAIVRNGDIVLEETAVNYDIISPEGLAGAIAQRRALSCDSFTVDRLGFTAQSSLDTDVLMFFSVPYDKGWSATVNGRRTVIEKANIGFMAVRVPAGDAVIRFEYRTPGLKAGALISLAGLAILMVYLLICRLVRPRRSRAARTRMQTPPQTSPSAPPTTPIPQPTLPQGMDSLEDYLNTLDDLPPIESEEDDPQ